MLVLFLLIFGVFSIGIINAEQQQCPDGIDRGALVPLISFSNVYLGAFRDHFATTWTPGTHPQALRGYEHLEVLGLVPNSSEIVEKKCECLQEIVQLFDEQPGLGGDSTKPGLFGRLDHKLVKIGEESNQLFENYMRTGERLWCVSEYGQCGASVPLYQWFAASEIGRLLREVKWSTTNLQTTSLPPEKNSI